MAPHRRLLAAEAKATVRFETPPGRQPQIDFGTSRVPVGGEAVRSGQVEGQSGSRRLRPVRRARAPRAHAGVGRLGAPTLECDMIGRDIARRA